MLLHVGDAEVTAQVAELVARAAPGLFEDAARGAASGVVGAVNATTGSAVRTWYSAANGPATRVAAAGPTLYVGGAFTKLGGAVRHRLAAVSPATRTVQPFNPSADWTVRAITVSPGRSKVYAVGGFDTIGGAPREGVAGALGHDGCGDGTSRPRVEAWELRSRSVPTV